MQIDFRVGDYGRNSVVLCKLVFTCAVWDEMFLLRLTEELVQALKIAG